jgi:hypothetical protein
METDLAQEVAWAQVMLWRAEIQGTKDALEALLAQECLLDLMSELGLLWESRSTRALVMLAVLNLE